MNYQAKKFEYLIDLEGFSEQLLNNHFTLYQGYVANTNKLNDTLVNMEKEGKFNNPEYAELNRRFGWEFNGMRLHEYYFGNLTKKRQETKILNYFQLYCKNSSLMRCGKKTLNPWGQ